MLRLSLPHFFEKDFSLHQENSACKTLIINGAEPALFDQYRALFEENGGTLKQQYETDVNRFAAFFDGKDAVFMNYFIHTQELQIVTERDSLYFNYIDQAGEALVTPQLTQLHLEDFGMCYLIRLSDGRFILIDGGREFEPDADRLFETLKKNSPTETPRIAAWIMSHPHNDHFHCFFPFMERHGKEVEIEKFFYNFPEHDDLEHYPKLRLEPDAEKKSEYYWLPRFYEWVDRLGVPVYTPHTGQQYLIGDAVFDVLATMDDTIHCSDNINATSLVLRMQLTGQTILWTSDAGFGFARLPERYQETLKADILQVPHHGFGCGPAEKEIEGYEYIRPRVCLLPVAPYHAYSCFGSFKEGPRHILSRMNVQEMITGEVTRTLKLPYTARENGARELYENYKAGCDDAGARTWVFTDLDTGKPEDFVFTILNMTMQHAKVRVDIFFQDRSQNIQHSVATIERFSFKTLNVTDPEKVDGNADYFNRQSLLKMPIPEHTPFAIRFLSNVPIVVSHREHQAAYHSTYNQ